MKLAAFFLLAAAAHAGTIYLTGGGTFGRLYPELPSYDAHLSGTNGVDSIGINISKFGMPSVMEAQPGCFCTMLLNGFGSWMPTVTFWSFALGGGTGHAAIFDASGELASVDLIGFVGITSRTELQGPAPGVNYTGTFAVTPTEQAPEPATWLLIGAGLLLVVARRNLSDLTRRRIKK